MRNNCVMKYAAAITLYNPTIEEIDHCQLYAEAFDIVYLLDNSEVSSKKTRESFMDEKFVYIKMNGNEGLPKAFNTVLNRKDLLNYDFLCTLDQDSIFNNEEIEKLKSFISDVYFERIKDLSYNRVAIFAPIVDYGRGISRSEGYEKRKKVITSGTFLNLKLIENNSFKYDEDYFIDKFEIDLCQQILLANKDIVVYRGSILIQHLGDTENSKHSSHSPLRHYYLFRNRFYFNNKFYKWPKRYILNTLQTLRHCYSIISYEPNKMKKLKQLPIAIRDYRKNNMGKRRE